MAHHRHRGARRGGRADDLFRGRGVAVEEHLGYHQGGSTPELVWVTLGIVTMLALSRLDYRWLRLISVPLFLGAVVLLIIVLGPAHRSHVPQGGRRVRALAGRRRDARQPAHLVPSRRDRQAGPGHLPRALADSPWQRRSVGCSRAPCRSCASRAVSSCSSALEPNLGTTGVITLTAFTMFFVAGASRGDSRCSCPSAPRRCRPTSTRRSTSSTDGTRSSIHGTPIRTRRITPSRDCTHSVLVGCSARDWATAGSPVACHLPNAANDFVFAMVGQELGLVGASLVIGGFMFMAWRGIRVGLRAPDTFGGLLAIGISAWLGFQAFINIGVVVHCCP